MWTTKNIETIFLDSGAFSQLTIGKKYYKEHGGDRWGYFYSAEFHKYMDSYAKFIEKYKKAIDFYANLDVIFNPELTWNNQKYLEEKYNLQPVPILHYGTDTSWIQKYLENGYDYIGIGGKPAYLGVSQHMKWLDKVFNIICDNPKRLPSVKTHGFGISSIRLWLRYPWWSIDSSSVSKKAAYGWILVPFFRKGRFIFDRPPLHISMSEKSPLMTDRGRHFTTLTGAEKRIILRWLDYIKIPLGNECEPGVINNLEMRRIALFYFYEYAKEAIPKWPWPFKSEKTRKLI